jgi:type IV pilus assembly protein PilB
VSAPELLDPRALAADLTRARSAAIDAGFDFVDLDSFEIDPASAHVLPEPRARRDRAVGIGWRYGLPIVAVAHPEDLFTLDDIYLEAGRDVHIVVASDLQIEQWIDRIYVKPAARHDPVTVGPAELIPARSGDLSGWTSPIPPAPSAHLSVVGGADPSPALTGQSSPALDISPVVTESTVAEIADDATPDPAGEEVPQLRVISGSALDAEPLIGIEDNLGVDLEEDPAPTGLDAGLDSGPEPFGELGSLARILVDTGKVSPRDMEVVLRQQVASGRPLREVLAELGLVSEGELQRAVAQVEGLEFVDLNNWTIDQAAAELLPESLARRYHILGIGFRGERPVIAMANPSDVFALDDVRSLLGREVEAVICAPQQVTDYLLRIYRRSDETDVAARNAALSAAASEATQLGEINDLHVVVEDAPIVKFVNLIMRQALDERASDIHIEPTSDDLQVRFRIDGVLHHVTSAPKAIQGGVVSRLKIMADLDIAEHRVPQDGRLSLTAGNREIDLRVATLPTVHGEKVVLRVLDKSTAPLDLARLGFMPEVLARYEESYRKASGTILVTGPTGSGKSTTLYATLNKLNLPERNLITVEDPVEYQLRGVNQVQVNPRAGLNFANALRSILRSDPDVVLVGEIRDRETATIAVEAALTGHLVLTCLHTNDAASSPLRLIEMGVEPFLVCSALDCVLAQRLARLLCQNCAEDYQPTPEELIAARWVPENTPPSGELRFRRATGCQACSNTGYHGRLAIQEVMTVTEELERAILARAPTEEIKRLAVFEGMRTLHRDGLRKAAMGLTSLEEILRVIV